MSGLRLVTSPPVQSERAARVEALTMIADAYVEALKVPGLSDKDRRSLRRDLATCERVTGRRTALEAI